jgi:hypothetical protein
MGNVPAVIPAGAPPAQLDFGEMLRRAQVLAKTELVPKPLQGKPEAIVVIGVWGAEHGVPLMTAIQEVHVIENRPSPSAQLRLALIRRAGHEARFLDTDSTKAVLRARRREYRHDPDAWVTVTYTIDDARRAGLLDRWVEQWVERRKQTWRIGDDQGTTDLTGAPEWVRKAVDAGDIRMKDNWQKYPADMLRARAASVMSRMEFSDVLAALDADDYTAEELGLDVGQDLDEPVDAELVDTKPTERGDGPEEVIDDAVVVEDPEPEPAAAPPAEPQTAAAPVPGEDPGPQMPAATEKDRADIAALKHRIRRGMTSKGWAGLVPWLEACGIPATLDGVTRARVAAVDAELDLRGVARLQPETDG